MKKIGFCFAATMLFVLIIPGFISLFSGVENAVELSEPLGGPSRDDGGRSYAESEDKPLEKTVPASDNERAPVFNPQTEALIDFEDYICGVVAAEMPVEYDTEALKAQAVAARTYARRRLGDAKSVSASDIESIAQAYLSEYDLISIWGSDFDECYAKIKDAVKATEGSIMVYENEPIEAVFHSSSAGMTEDAENVWYKEYPYLKGVVSPGDYDTSEKRFEEGALLELLRNSFSGLYLTDAGFMQQFQVISRTSAGYVREAQVGNTTLTGRQIREALGLRSSAFTVKEDNGEIVFVTRGYGHGVGMSQTGAEYMAENGYGYKEILKYYYTDVEIRD